MDLINFVTNLSLFPRSHVIGRQKETRLYLMMIWHDILCLLNLKKKAFASFIFVLVHRYLFFLLGVLLVINPRLNKIAATDFLERQRILCMLLGEYASRNAAFLIHYSVSTLS